MVDIEKLVEQYKSYNISLVSLAKNLNKPVDLVKMYLENLGFDTEQHALSILNLEQAAITDTPVLTCIEEVEVSQDIDCSEEIDEPTAEEKALGRFGKLRVELRRRKFGEVDDWQYINAACAYLYGVGVSKLTKHLGWRDDRLFHILLGCLGITHVRNLSESKIACNALNTYLLETNEELEDKLIAVRGLCEELQL